MRTAAKPGTSLRPCRSRRVVARARRATQRLFTAQSGDGQRSSRHRSMHRDGRARAGERWARGRSGGALGTTNNCRATPRATRRAREACHTGHSEPPSQPFLASPSGALCTHVCSLCGSVQHARCRSRPHRGVSAPLARLETTRGCAPRMRGCAPRMRVCTPARGWLACGTTLPRFEASRCRCGPAGRFHRASRAGKDQGASCAKHRGRVASCFRGRGWTRGGLDCARAAS